MRTILIVDDQQLCREMISTAMEKRGYRTIVANSGEDALRAIEAEKPDLVILDAVMPRMDGLACLQVLRADARFRTLPVILLTGSTSRDFVVKARALGAQDYILKTGLSLVDLLARVRRHMAAPLGEMNLDDPMPPGVSAA